MRLEDLHQLRMQEGFAAQNPEVAVAVLFRVVDEPFHVVERDVLGFVRDVHPAPLATQLTARHDGDEQEWRKGLATLQPALVLLYRQHALKAEVVGEFAQQAEIGLGKHTAAEREHHNQESPLADADVAARASRARAAACSALARIASGLGSEDRT